MRKADILVALLLVGLGVVVLVEGWRLGIGWSTDGPRSGFFIFYLGLALVVSCLLVLGQALGRRRAPRAPRPFLQPGQLGSVATVAVPAALMVALTGAIGLYVAGGLYLGVYMRWVGRHSWLPTLLLAVAVPLGTFLVFEVWFLVPLPKGPLEAFLGY